MLFANLPHKQLEDTNDNTTNISYNQYSSHHYVSPKEFIYQSIILTTKKIKQALFKGISIC